MAEIDYQMALLLQHRFEQEYKSTKNTQQSDRELARLLQEEFEQEAAIEKPSPSLVYKPPKQGLNSSKCLTDPSWELVDPTPDIHGLFLAFNERFFWNKLLAVCVSWSKRMTSCAGVCSYNGRGGMCSITLSEPLLKLRPRKDLVETLLHEMIHAFLFVTHNNRDRDGHGPEFHKHMVRINKEAGTNITVYHNFHDEVRLYQQHWWRCNGPCQHRKPYFGMVRRASNRAPGPNDRWWAEHSLTCGGTFIKVKEPEKKTKQKKAEVKSTSKGKSKDIRDFMPAVKGSAGSSNVKGFKDLVNKVKGKYNSTSTIVVTKNTSSTSTSDSCYKPTIFNANASSRKTEVDRTSTSCSDDFLAVRNHWANRFSNTNKRPTDVEETGPKSKLARISESTSSDDYCECPVCNQRVLMADLNRHLDDCLKKDSETVEPEIVDLTEEMRDCPMCDAKIGSSSFDGHVEKCLLKMYDHWEEPEASEEEVSCLACGKKILKKDLNSHLDDCMSMSGIFEVEDGEGKTSECVESSDKDSTQFNCPFCMELVEESAMKDHIDACLKTDNVVEALMDTAF